MQKQIAKIIFLWAVFLAVPGFAFAAPAIIDAPASVLHRQSVTVSGSGFGVKSVAAPIKWETFEDGTNGALLNTTGFWSVYSDNPDGDKPQFSAAQNRHIASNKTAKFIYQRPDNGLHDVAIRNVPEFATTRKIYFDYWIYFSWAAELDIHQIKTGRIGSGTGDSYVYPTLIDESWTYDGGSRNHYSECRNENTSACAGTLSDYGSSYTNSAWNHVQWEVSVDTESTSDGYYKIWLNGQPWAEQTGADMVIGANTFRQVWLGTYLGNSVISMSNTLYYDDVYIDSSLQRIEIGNASTYASCTHRETQIPTAWADDSIGFTANQEAFTNEQAYIYVVDENGEANAEGFPIQFSSSSDITAPTNPSGLSVM